MKILIALTLLVTLALLGSSKRFYSWRRTRLGAALTTGGWLFVLFGVLLGEHGAGLASPDQLLAVQPLIHFCLGWVGLMIGLQADRRLPKALPAPVRWVTIVDWLVSIVVFTAVAAGVLFAMGGGGWGTGAVAGLMGMVAIGWPADARSVRHEGGSGEQLTRMIRAVSGLGAILAVIAYGLMIKSFEIDAAGTITGWSANNALFGSGVSLGIGLGMGMMGSWLMRVAGTGRSEFLVVLLGLTAMLSGAAATMGYSPIFVALWAGALICNIPGKALDPLKRVLIEAEQPIAMALMLVAGVLLDPRIGAVGWSLVAAIVITRALTKAAIGWWGIAKALETKPSGHVVSQLARQSPLAIALATGYAISAYGQPESGAPLTGGQVVMVVVTVGLIVQVWALIQGPRDAGTAAAAKVDTEPDEPTKEETQP